MLSMEEAGRQLARVLRTLFGHGGHGERLGRVEGGRIPSNLLNLGTYDNRLEAGPMTIAFLGGGRIVLETRPYAGAFGTPSDQLPQGTPIRRRRFRFLPDDEHDQLGVMLGYGEVVLVPVTNLAGTDFLVQDATGEPLLIDPNRAILVHDGLIWKPGADPAKFTIDGSLLKATHAPGIGTDLYVLQAWLL